jgi:hypothetical protein
MHRINSFFLFASGADRTILKECPSDTSKYAGIGATIFFTGLLAALAAAYGLYTVFNSYVVSIFFGLIWGLMIFNLDRYIVSSMRKDSRFWREFVTATPRIVLAIVISLVIAKPLELKIFEKEIEPELVIMEQQVFARQDSVTKGRFVPVQDELRQQIALLKAEVHRKTDQRDHLLRLAQEEADGTGGSKRKNLGPIYTLKKADADKAERELVELMQTNAQQIQQLESRLAETDQLEQREITSLTRSKLDGFAARLEALNRLTQQSVAMYWANVFIILLFIIVETAPILVKLISRSGPYDSLLHITEHSFLCKEVEAIAITSSATKQRTADTGQQEKAYVERRLDAELL